MTNIENKNDTYPPSAPNSTQPQHNQIKSVNIDKNEPVGKSKLEQHHCDTESDQIVISEQLASQNTSNFDQFGHNSSRVAVAGNNDNVQSNEIWTENPPSSASSGFSDDDSLTCTEGDPKTIEQIVRLVRERGRSGLTKEYSDIRSRTPNGTFSHARLRPNLSKNRYTDVLCYDHTRVILSQENDEPSSDYINANFVDGYKQRNAYISTQGRIKISRTRAIIEHIDIVE